MVVAVTYEGVSVKLFDDEACVYVPSMPLELKTTDYGRLVMRTINSPNAGWTQQCPTQPWKPPDLRFPMAVDMMGIQKAVRET